MQEGLNFIYIILAAFTAGGVNAIAGGGTLITFPVLTALGLPVITANVTNTVALCPGYISAAMTGYKELKENRKLLFFLVPTGILGGLAGGFLLLHASEKIFHFLIPYLILFASVLLAFQNTLKAWLQKRQVTKKPGISYIFVAIPVGIASIYGGYFGAGLGVILLALLGMLLHDSLNNLNVIKQFLSFFINSSAAVLFLFSGQVNWPIALIMAIGAFFGGIAGGKLAGKINANYLRWIVALAGLIIATSYFDLA